MKPSRHYECLGMCNAMTQDFGRFILLVIIKFLKSFIAWKFNEHRASLYEIALQIFCTVYRRDQTTTMLFNQLQNDGHVFVVVSLSVVYLDKNYKIDTRGCVSHFRVPPCYNN